MSRALCCDVAKKVRNHALRKVVRLDLIGNRQLLQFRHQTPVSPDDAPYQTFVAKMVEFAFVAVSLSRGIDQRQIARLVGVRNRLFTLREIELLDRQSDFLGEPDPDKAACGNRVPVSYQAGCFLGADDLPAIQCLDRRKR